MEEVKKEQYQHNGKGTAILINKDYNHIPTRKIFNGQKSVTGIIVDEDKKRISVEVIHADNGALYKNWNKIVSDLNNRRI